MRIRFTRAFDYQGRSFAEGDVTGALAAADAEALVRMGVAESVATETRAADPAPAGAGGTTVGITDEQLDRILNPTGDEVDAEAQRRSGQQRNTPPLHTPGVTPSQTRANGAPTVGTDRETRWEMRAVRYMRGAVMAGDVGSIQRMQRGRAILQRLAEVTLDMPQSQFEAEVREAESLIEASGLPAAGQRRVRDLIRSYTGDIGALRSVAPERRGMESPLVGTTSAQERTHSTLEDTAGGYLVPTPFLAELFVVVEEYGYARRIFTTIPMTSNRLRWNEIGGKPVAAWYGELERIEASDISFGEGGMDVAKLAGITTLSTEVEEDAAIALLPVWIRLMGEAIAEKEDSAAFLGDGTKAYGGQVGLFELAGTSVYTMGAGQTSRADFTVEDGIAMKNTLSKARRKNARWVLSESVVTALITLKRNNEANNFILLDPNDPGRLARFLGYPVVDAEGLEDQFFPADGAGKKFAAFGDFRYSYFGQRRGMTVETSRVAVLNDAQGNVVFNAMQQDGQVVKVTERIGIGHVQPDRYVVGKTAGE